jgi:hypothetical protein
LFLPLAGTLLLLLSGQAPSQEQDPARPFGPVQGLARALPGQELPFDWDGLVFRLRVEEVGPSPSGARTLVRGALVEDPDSQVLLVHQGGVMAASVRRGAEEFEVRHAGQGRHLAQEAGDAHALPCRVEILPPDPAPAISDPTTDRLIDLMVAYTPLAAAWAGGAAGLEAQIELRVAEANQAYTDSLADQQVRLVHLHQVNYTETGTTTDLTRLRLPSDGYMDEVPVLREGYGADIVSLIILDSAQFCGTGYLFTPTSGGASLAFNVVTAICLSNRTLAHELGHNMGCQHDQANAGSQGYFPYSYGYRTPDALYRTIMAYAPGTRINYFSNPDVQWTAPNGNTYALGMTNADNATTLTNTAPLVAAFRPARKIYWDNLGGALGGGVGTPTLSGQGTVNLIEPVTVAIGGVPAGIQGVLHLGFTQAGTRYNGGAMIPSMDRAFPLDSGGSLDLSRLVTAYPAGTAFYLQWWAQTPTGWIATDGWKATLP